jgi:alpha-1,2-rhamnosyltransferase
MAKIFVDCTYTFATRGDRGIARVVRNIVRQARGHPNVSPVVFARGAFHVAAEQELSSQCSRDARGHWFAARLVRSCWSLLAMIASVLPPAFGRRLLAKTVYNKRLGPRAKFYLSRVGAVGHLDEGERSVAGSDTTAAFAPGDVLFLPDASWNVDCDAFLFGLSKKGVRIVLLCHDLLPLTHKHLCSDPQDVFGQWLCRWLPRADGVICNSRSTRQQLRRFVNVLGIPLRADCWIESCPLGGDLEGPAAGVCSAGPACGPEPSADGPLPVGSLRTAKYDRLPGDGVEIHAAMAMDEPYYLTVGAIEPRKNHALLLQAFELFRRGGGTARTVWVGRWTMDAEPLRRQVMSNGGYGRWLVALQGVPDAALAALYKHARAAIFPSLGEGFGLPLAEALFHGCPVLASDIPAHREVCGDRAIYFDPNDALSLASVLAEIERGERALAPVVAGEVPSWEQSVTRMFELIERHCDGAPG